MTKATLTKGSIYLRAWLQFENISWLSTGLGMRQNASSYGAGACKQAWCRSSGWDLYILIHRQQAKIVRDKLGMMGPFETSKPTLSNTPCPKRPWILILPNSLPTRGYSYSKHHRGQYPGVSSLLIQWNLRIKLRLLGLSSRHFHLLSHYRQLII